MAQIKITSPIGGFKHLKQRIEELDLFKVEVGWFASAKHPVYEFEEGDPIEVGDIPTASIAASNEFGDPARGIPPRPFMRPALTDNLTTWREQIKRGTKAVIHGTKTDTAIMEGIGLSVSRTIDAYISLVHSPKLSEETIQNRLKFRADKTTIGNLDKPLVFEGILKTSVTYIVKDGVEVRPIKGGR